MKFQGYISRMFATTIEVEADDEEQAEEKIRHILEYEDTSGLEWEHVRKSDVVDEVVPLEGE